MSSSSVIGRVAALIALVVAVVVVVMLLDGGEDYEVTAEFENAGQLPYRPGSRHIGAK